MRPWKRLLASGFAIFISSTPPHQALASNDHVARARDWQIKCAPGTDEYASNCNAIWKMQGLKISLTTADSQIWLSVEGSRCPRGEGVKERNWFRVDLEGLPPRTRHELVQQAVSSATETLRRICLGLPPATSLPREFPDLAARGAS